MKKPVKKSKVGRKPLWKADYYVGIYDLARNGHTNSQIAAIIGVSIMTLKRWIRIKPALKRAIRKARRGDENNAKASSFLEYVYGQLPPNIKDVWDELTQYESESNSLRKIEMLLGRQREDVLKHLFVHALVDSNFNASKACQRVGISKVKLDKWCQDSDFQALLAQIEWHKDNLFESALIGLVKQGETGAVIFANKSRNKKRGYADTKEVSVKGGVVHTHLEVDDLPIELQREILAALREKRRKEEGLPALPPSVDNVIDVELED